MNGDVFSKLTRRLFLGSLTLLALAKAQKKTVNKMKISLKLGKDSFVARESIILSIAITNDGSGLIRIPDPESGANAQPAYTVRGPSYPQGHTFTYGRPKPAGKHDSPDLIEIPAGATHEGEIPIHSNLQLLQTGKHSLEAELDWEGQKVRSNTLEFSVGPATVHSAKVMADDGFQRPFMQRVLALIGEPPGLYQLLFSEKRPAIGEIRFSQMTAVAGISLPGASEVLAPWTNFTRSDVFFFRTGWRSGNRIGIESGDASLSMSYELSPGSDVVHPPLMTKDGETRIFARSAGELQVIVFPLASEGTPVPKASEGARLPLPASLQAACAALGPDPQKTAFVFGASNAGKDLRLYLFAHSTGIASRTAEHASAHLLPQSQPALWVDRDGLAHAALLVSTPEDPLDLSLLTIDWKAPDQEPQIVRKSVAKLPAASVASTVSFSVTGERPPRCNWVVLLEDGKLMTSRSPGRVHAVSGKPILPLQLLSMSPASYLLTTDEANILNFRNLQ